MLANGSEDVMLKHGTKRKGSYEVPFIRKDGTVERIVVTFRDERKPVKLAGKGF